MFSEKILSGKIVSSPIIFLLKTIRQVSDENFRHKTFCDRDLVMNDVSSPYVLGDKIRTFEIYWFASGFLEFLG